MIFNNLYISCRWGSGCNPFLGKIICYLWTCETRKKLFSPKIQWCDIRRIPVLDIPFKKRESERKKESFTNTKQFLNPAGQGPLGLRILCGLRICSLGLELYPLILRLCPVGHPSIFMKVACVHKGYSWVVLSACLLSVEFCYLTVFFYFIFVVVVVVPFSLSCQYFCWNNILKNLSVSYYIMGFIPWDKRVLHRFFLDNAISVSGFCWGGWGNSWVTCLILLKVLLVNRYSDLFILLRH